ncbi:MAG: hypothetical protein Q7T58_03185 [Methylotenera sp.]|nr:hypothetical protein [Methylotenera sp.]
MKIESAKREQQDRSRALVRGGVSTQEPMFFIPVDIAKLLRIRHRTDEF